MTMMMMTVMMMMQYPYHWQTFASIPPLPRSLLEPAAVRMVVIISQMFKYDIAIVCMLKFCLCVVEFALNTTCNEVRILHKHVDLLRAIAARRLVKNAIHVSEKQAHISSHLHRQQRRKAIIVGECAFGILKR